MRRIELDRYNLYGNSSTIPLIGYVELSPYRTQLSSLLEVVPWYEGLEARGPHGIGHIHFKWPPGVSHQKRAEEVNTVLLPNMDHDEVVCVSVLSVIDKAVQGLILRVRTFSIYRADMILDSTWCSTRSNGSEVMTDLIQLLWFRLVAWPVN